MYEMLVGCTLIPIKATFGLSVSVPCNKYRLVFIYCTMFHVCSQKCILF